MRRRRLATKLSAALTVAFLVVVPNSLADSAKSSSFRSIIVFMLPSVLPRTYRRQYQWAASRDVAAARQDRRPTRLAAHRPARVAPLPVFAAGFDPASARTARNPESSPR